MNGAMTDATTTIDSFPNDDPLTQAAHWFVLLASGEASDDDRTRWQQWCAADAAHARAWSRVQAASAPFAAVPRTHSSAAVDALTRKPTARRGATLLSVFVAGLLGLAGWQGYRFSDWSADALTDVGEQRELQLADGSRLLLDTDTAVDIDFDDKQRRLHLRRGRVLIETGHLPAFARQAFVVTTPQAHVTALGTQFTVQRIAPDSPQQRTPQTRVAVIRDRVAVRGSGDDRVILEAGQGALIDHDGNVVRATPQRNDSAWQRGMLIADDMPLGDFLAQLARYRNGELHYDASVADLRISGAFPLHDTDQVLAALTETLPLRIERVEDGISLRAKK